MTNKDNDLESLITEFDALKDKMKNRLKPYLKSLCNETITGIKFACYTPYYSDGDLCEFSINTIYVKYPGISEDAGDNEDGWEDAEYGIDDDKIAEKAYKVTEAIEAIPEEIIKYGIGDGYKVTITKDSVEIEEYEHD